MFRTQMNVLKTRKSVIATLVASALLGMGGQALAQFTGPSSSQSAYATPTAPGWTSMSVLTVGDSVPLTGGAPGQSYRMVGIPDGLGAYDNGNGTFTVLMNHELGQTAGIARAHGGTGAFVSEWIINKSNFSVVSGSDLIKNHFVWDGLNYVKGTGSSNVAGVGNSFARLCSADLPAVSAFYNAATGLGTQSRIFMNGEETGSNGRAYATMATGAQKGNSYQLPALGRFSWENSVANPYSGNETIVVGMDDSTPGQVYVYKGMKNSTGVLDIDKAGLTNGQLYGVKVAGTPTETAPIVNKSFTLEQVVAQQNGDNLQTQSVNAGITQFARPEDGAWADKDTFYFVTTGASGQTAKLYKLNFATGTVTVALDSATLVGKDGQVARSFDNITVGEDGSVVIQEDPGNTNYIAKTWIYDPKSGTAKQILESDRARFLTGAPGFLTQDEESSGVIEITSILGKNDGKRYFLADMQAHYGIAGELVEGGQLYIAAVPEPSTYAMMLAGLGLFGGMVRRRRSKESR